MESGQKCKHKGDKTKAHTQNKRKTKGKTYELNTNKQVQT